jgi:hypothetical protein
MICFLSKLQHFSNGGPSLVMPSESGHSKATGGGEGAAHRFFLNIRTVAG